jgi:5S rRNA maturation endonuclease (ribonuclease M5)
LIFLVEVDSFSKQSKECKRFFLSLEELIKQLAESPNEETKLADRVTKKEIEEARNADIVSVIESTGVILKKSGDRYVGRSPFHNDETPSLTVYPETNTFKDYGGGKYRGGAIEYMMLFHGWDFKTAVRELCGKRSGKFRKAKKTSKKEEESKEEKDFSGHFYTHTMRNRDEDTDKYLTLKKGLPTDFVSELREQKAFGYTLHEWKESGYGCISFPFKRLDSQEMVALQLISCDGSPITDEKSDKKFMYKSKTTGFFQHGNLDSASIIIVTEGVLNSLSCFVAWRNLRPETEVAVLATGSATSTKQLGQLKSPLKHGKRIVLFQDNDAAGNDMAKGAAKSLPGITAVMWDNKYPEKYDSNDLWKANEADVIVEMVETAKLVEASTSKQSNKKQNFKSQSVNHGGLPMIDVTEEKIPEDCAKSWDALTKVNDPPKILKYAKGLVAVETDEEKGPVLNTLREDNLRHYLARAAHYFEVGKNDNVVSVIPPRYVVRDMLVDPHPPLPDLSRIIHYPIFASDGRLQVTKGYDPKTRCWYSPIEPLSLPEIPSKPSSDDLSKAVGIFEDLIADFPFVTDAEKGNIWALFILLYVRELIDGPTPLHLIEASSPGEGKSLLAEVVTYPALGQKISSMTAGRNEKEWREKITAILVSGRNIVLFDNVTTRLDSGTLSTALTSRFWDDRVIYQPQVTRFPIYNAWVATGNNPTLSTEIARRSIRIRLDRKVDRPWRTDSNSFRHPNIREWVKENRSELVWSALVVCRAWFAEGCPAPKGIPILGSYEEWTRVIGGILQTAGIPGFLGNLDEFYESSDSEGTELRDFIAAWWERHGRETVGVKELYQVIIEKEIDLSLRGNTERGQKTSLGKLLKSIRDRQFGNYRVSFAGGKKGAKLWRLVPTHIKDAGAPPHENGAGSKSSDTEEGMETGYI